MAEDGTTALGTAATNAADAAARVAEDLGSSPAAVRAHLALLPARYAAVLTPRSIVRHAALAATRPEPAEVRTRVTPDEPADPTGPEGDGMILNRLDVVALDTPRLFAKVVGVLSLHGGSIVAADAFARDDGIAVDTFSVVRPPRTSSSWIVRVEGDLHEASAGRLALRARVAAEVQGRSRSGRVPEVATKVRVGRDDVGEASVVEVRTSDRPGVLFAIATALDELDLGLVVARVQTLGHEVVDTFTVRTCAGGAMDADHADELELALRHALSRGSESSDPARVL